MVTIPRRKPRVTWKEENAQGPNHSIPPISAWASTRSCLTSNKTSFGGRSDQQVRSTNQGGQSTSNRGESSFAVGNKLDASNDPVAIDHSLDLGTTKCHALQLRLLLHLSLSDFLTRQPHTKQFSIPENMQTSARLSSFTPSRPSLHHSTIPNSKGQPQSTDQSSALWVLSSAVKQPSPFSLTGWPASNEQNYQKFDDLGGNPLVPRRIFLYKTLHRFREPQECISRINGQYLIASLEP